MNTIVITILALCAIGVAAAIILYFVAQKFKVYEDPRIDEVEEALPAANCGGCGYPGCRGFAEALVKADDISKMNCPVGGAAVMSHVGALLGHEIKAADPTVAVVRCNGTCDNRPKTSNYDGATSCAVASGLYGGETGCSFGCLGLGDCEVACDFDALYINKETGRNMLLWEGACIVHEAFSIDKLLDTHKTHPEAKIIAHPESEEHILKTAAYIGSTSGLINYAKTDPAKEFIVATEAGILHEMQKEVPDKTLYPAPATEDNTQNVFLYCSRETHPELSLSNARKSSRRDSISFSSSFSCAIDSYCS